MLQLDDFLSNMSSLLGNCDTIKFELRTIWMDYSCVVQMLIDGANSTICNSRFQMISTSDSTLKRGMQLKVVVCAWFTKMNCNGLVMHIFQHINLYLPFVVVVKVENSTWAFTDAMMLVQKNLQIDYEKEQEWIRKVRTTWTDWRMSLETIIQWSPYSTEAELIQEVRLMLFDHLV